MQTGRKQSDITELLRIRIITFFYESPITDKEMMALLKNENFVIKQRRFELVRKKLGLKKRIYEYTSQKKDQRVLEIL